MESSADPTSQSDNYFRDLAILDWLVEMGADEAISEAGINRFEIPDAPPAIAKPMPAAEQPRKAAIEPASMPTENLAASCQDLDSLKAAIEQFEGCALKQGARNTLFAGGNPAARVMIIGNAPDREEDKTGTFFAGQNGRLLDKMLAAIGLSRNAEQPDLTVYLSSIIPWRTPQDREPLKTDIALMKPFLLRHIALAKPEVLVLMGSIASKTLLETDNSVARIRGQWGSVLGIPTLPMFHPANLLRTRSHKRAAWADLLALQNRLSS